MFDLDVYKRIKLFCLFMKTTKVFEQNMRECSYASLDSARAGVIQRPMVADYLIDLLVDRGVIKIQPDGTVVGAEDKRYEGRTDPKESVSGEWRTNWPSKQSLLNILGAKPAGAKFRDLQGSLIQDGEPASHWIVLHAIWNLTKASLVVKDGKKYRLTDAGEIASYEETNKGKPNNKKSAPKDDSWHREDFDEVLSVWSEEMEAAFKTAFKSFDGETDQMYINSELEKTKEGRDILHDAPGKKLNQTFIDYAVRRLTEWGELPSRSTSDH